MKHVYLGLDAGSSFTKAALFDASGRQLGEASCRLAQSRPAPGWCEIDAEAAWRAAATVMREVVETTGVAPGSVAGIGLSAAMVGAWAVDAEGVPLRPGILWEDSRAQDLIAGMQVEDPGLLSTIFRSSGSVLQQGCTLPVLAWLARHEPDTVAKAAHVFGYKDFLRLRLTGAVATDISEAAVAPGSARERGRSEAMIDLFGLRAQRRLLPDPLPSETVAGALTEAAATPTGLKVGTPVVVGAGDVPATVIGAGGLDAGMATAVLGTTCMVGVCHDRPVFDPPDMGLLFTMPDNHWYRSMVNVAGTLNLDWALSVLAPDLAGRGDLFDHLNAMVAAVPTGANGVTYLPYLSESGIIAPRVDPAARAQFCGLAPRHTRADMLRAVFEGVAYAMRDLVDALAFEGPEIRLTGGGARSPLWVGMIASLTGRDILVPAGSEFGARGAALLAATALGQFDSVRDASVSVGADVRRVRPDTTHADAWSAGLEAYRHHRDRLLGA